MLKILTIAAFLTFSSEEDIHLKLTEFPAQNISTLIKQIQKTPNIKKIEIINLQDEIALINIINSLKGKKLELVNFQASKFGKNAASALKTVLSNPNTLWENLNLSECNINEEVLSIIAEGISHNNSLTSINLSLNNINGSDILSLTNILKSPNLLTLKINANNLFNQDIRESKLQEFLKHLKSAPNLKSLFLENNQLDDHFAALLFNNITESQSLIEIDLGANKLTNIFCKEILLNLGQTTIANIYLRSNNFGWEGDEILKTSYETNNKIKIIATSTISHNGRLSSGPKLNISLVSDVKNQIPSVSDSTMNLITSQKRNIN